MTKFQDWRATKSIKTNILIDALLVIKDLIALILIGVGVMAFMFIAAVVLLSAL